MSLVFMSLRVEYLNSKVGHLTFKITLLQVCLKLTECLACPRYYRMFRQQSDLWSEPEPADIYAQPRSPKDFLWGWLPRLQLCLCSCEGVGGAVLFYNCEDWEDISGCLASQTMLQMSALCMHPQGWACFELTMKTGYSDLTWEENNKQVPLWDTNHSGAIRGELCLPIWFRGLLFPLLSMPTFVGLFCFLQGKRGAHLQ